MTVHVDEHQPGRHFDNLLGRRNVDARIKNCSVHEEGLPLVSAHFLYPAFKGGKPSVAELVKMLMREITGFAPPSCSVVEQKRKIG